MRFGQKAPSDSNYYNKEVALNELMSLMQNIHQLGTCSNRQVTLNSAAAVEITPTAGTRVMHISNNLTVVVRYGGSGVTTSTGGKIYNGASFAFAVTSTSSIYLIPETGGAQSIDIIEFS